MASAFAAFARRFLAGAAFLFGAGACETVAPPFGRPRESVLLTIENPAGHRLRLCEVVDGPAGNAGIGAGGRDAARTAGAAPNEDLGVARRVARAVLSGRYRLEVVDGAGRSIALPIPALASVAPPAGLRVEIPARLIDPEPGWAWIPPGLALRGDALGVGQEDERPAHLVNLPGFFIAIDETTNAQYAEFLDDVGVVDPNWLDFGSLKCRVRRGDDGRYRTDAPNLPVVTVSYAGAEAYAAWRTRRDPEGRVHRLPTEAEWEKAARGPDTTTFDYGDVYRREAANQESGSLREAGSRPARGFGCRDLTGNAFEWVADAYDAAAYSGTEGRVVDAPRAAAGSAAADPPYRTLRGGSFVLDGMYLRNSFRMRQRAATRTDDFGFRVVRELPAAGEPR